MYIKTDAVVTAAMRPELFPGNDLFVANRVRVLAVLIMVVIAGLGLRMANLGAEGLSEDELNKLHAVADYREYGLTGTNGEHPMLMKALQTGCILLFERWNASAVAENHPSLRASTETALRFPGALFGGLTAILIYLLAMELFGAEVALMAAALWSLDPTAIGLNRIAKEDTFLLFFFVLANVFWLRGQRVAETRRDQRPEPYYWATAASFGAMMASKYLPPFIGVTIGYYWMFQAIPETRWRLGKIRMLKFGLIMIVVFLILSPTILLPETWREMGIFAGQSRIGHDGYEFMGSIYNHRVLDWLNGIPWYFYFVFVAVKLPPLTLAGFLIGLPFLFRRRSGDGRYFLLLWMFVFVMTFTFTGGKFTRYITIVLPALLITAALGVQYLGRAIVRALPYSQSSKRFQIYVPLVIAIAVILGSLRASASIGPHYRLYTNFLGGGKAMAGYYFPHDEFYDASVRDAIFEIAKQSRPRAKVAIETPGLAAYYALQANRSDLVFMSLSDPVAIKDLMPGDFLVVARGRRYFSNDRVISDARRSAEPVIRKFLGSVPSIEIYEIRGVQ